MDTGVSGAALALVTIFGYI